MTSRFTLSQQLVKSREKSDICNWCDKLHNVPKTVLKQDIEVLCAFFGSANKLGKYLGTDHKRILYWLKQETTNISYETGLKLQKIINIVENAKRELEKLEEE